MLPAAAASCGAVVIQHVGATQLGKKFPCVIFRPSPNIITAIVPSLASHISQLRDCCANRRLILRFRRGKWAPWLAAGASARTYALKGCDHIRSFVPLRAVSVSKERPYLRTRSK
ncbi:hypothetical protein BKA63DRAFT_484722 [Paraphoma chrysanthemicola]|nr:hypothetical protein BKA63DRAFT_484722 [Paraphoma chrysanthemicola]